MFPAHIKAKHCQSLRPLIVSKMIEYYESQNVTMGMADNMMYSIMDMYHCGILYFNVDSCHGNIAQNSFTDQIQIEIHNTEEATISIIPKKIVYDAWIEFGHMKFCLKDIKDKFNFLSSIDEYTSLDEYMQKYNLTYKDITKITFTEE